ncbi:cytochrome P450 [Rhizobium leguminosarum]|uniref:cytochrome P450 n=1 Tax=Rhizobium leguminosarum TaxID=384 RepID=UPI001C93F63E|nr:cytochrome P450 [Rhizobium leguminosarum]MBY5767019.1 cytochrome P450 [Rhizobium leguminosarum]
MGFLAEFDAAQEAETKIGVVIRWLRSDWRTMYAELRTSRPVLKTSAFTMVTRATDVLDVLSQPSLYSVRANQRTMDPSVGPFMLARDETEINWEEKGLLRALLRWDDLPRVRQLAREVATAALCEAEDGSLDVVPAIARQVPLRIVQNIFGFNAPDANVLSWSFATQHGMFRNLPVSQEVLARCHTAGEEMRAWLWPFLAAKWATAPSGGQDTVSRLVDLSRSPAAGISAERVLSNICGLLVGAIETMSQAIVQVIDQMLSHPEWLAAALAADARGDVTEFDAHVFEALRFNPITTIQFRFVEADREIGGGAPYATTVTAGTILAVCTGSAMFDAALMPDPDRFDPTRPPQSYLHFGIGHHECLGRYVGQVAIPEAVRQVLRMPAIKRAAGPAGTIDFNRGPFPEHMVVEWRASAPDVMLAEGILT